MFREGYDIDLLDTLSNQTPDHSVMWYLSVLLADLATSDAALHARLLAMPLGDLITHAAGGPLWKDIVGKLSPETVMTLACGNSLIARKR